MADPDLTHTGLLAAVAIGHHCPIKDGKGELYASQARLARWMHLAPSSTKTVRRAVRELEELGYLRPIGEQVDGNTLHFQLTVPRGVNDPRGSG
ncbi:hypothetical protein BJF90_26365 [Pseudonocardia sp. CNS-004]|nr:hypothetical protein BJF90_26365 [Pseudonocardia sp. CNS-004]